MKDSWPLKRPGLASDWDTVARQTLRAGICAPPPEKPYLRIGPVHVVHAFLIIEKTSMHTQYFAFRCHHCMHRCYAARQHPRPFPTRDEANRNHSGSENPSRMILKATDRSKGHTFGNCGKKKTALARRTSAWLVGSQMGKDMHGRTARSLDVTTLSQAAGITTTSGTAVLNFEYNDRRNKIIPKEVQAKHPRASA